MPEVGPTLTKTYDKGVEIITHPSGVQSRYDVAYLEYLKTLYETDLAEAQANITDMTSRISLAKAAQ